MERELELMNDEEEDADRIEKTFTPQSPLYDPESQEEPIKVTRYS